MSTAELLYPGLELRLGADGEEPFYLPPPDECCPDPLCLNTCAIACSFVDLLPTGPMWDVPKMQLKEWLRHSMPGDYDPCNPPVCESLPCPSMVLYAYYASQVLRDMVSNTLAVSVRESQPQTASVTIDDWLDRFGWEDCFRQHCRTIYMNELSPYEYDTECGPVYCPPKFSSRFECALKHATVLALDRASRGVIKNLDGINWVIEPLGAKLVPILPPAPAEEADGCHCCEARYALTKTGDTIASCPDAQALCSGSPGSVAAEREYICTDTGVSSLIYPGVITADCIARSLMVNKCPNPIAFIHTETETPPSLTLDFRNGIYQQSGFQKTFDELVTFARASTGTFWDKNGVLQTVAINEPRFEYNRATGLSDGLRIESSSTQELLHSADVTQNPPWFGQNDFVVTAVGSVLENQTAYRFENEGLIGSRSVHQEIGTLTGSEETASVIVENDTALVSSFGIRDNSAPEWVVFGNLNWNTLEFNISSGAGYSRVVDLGVGPSGGKLVRLSITGASPNPGNTRRIIFYPTGTGTNTDAAIIHHVQHQEQPGATNPIVTTVSPVTSAFDLANVDLSGLGSMDEVTIVATGRSPSVTNVSDATAYIMSTEFEGSIDDRATLHVLDAGVTEGDLVNRVQNSIGGSSVFFATGSVINPQNRQRTAVAIGPGGMAFAANGLLIDSNSNENMVPMDSMGIGRLANNTRAWNGTIERIEIYVKRLSDEELQAITA